MGALNGFCWGRKECCGCGTQVYGVFGGVIMMSTAGQCVCVCQLESRTTLRIMGKDRETDAVS